MQTDNRTILYPKVVNILLNAAMGLPVAPALVTERFENGMVHRYHIPARTDRIPRQ